MSDAREFPWAIVRRDSGRPVSVARFLSRESAEARIAALRLEFMRGKRPDLGPVFAAGLYARRVDDDLADAILRRDR